MQTTHYKEVPYYKKRFEAPPNPKWLQRIITYKHTFLSSNIKYIYNP